MRERFHELMVTIMKKEEDKVEAKRKELITILNTATAYKSRSQAR